MLEICGLKLVLVARGFVNSQLIAILHHYHPQELWSTILIDEGEMEGGKVA